MTTTTKRKRRRKRHAEARRKRQRLQRHGWDAEERAARRALSQSHAFWRSQVQDRNRMK
ncbi:MAG: hypothetical protein AAGF92_14920 [Myxococcota bacterium]